jgi:anti-sigma factor RsiW
MPNLPAEQLMAWLDGELTAEEAAAFEALLERHPEWRPEVEKLAGVVRASQRLRFAAPAPEAWDNYWQQIDSRLAKPAGWLLAAGGALLLLAAGYVKLLLWIDSEWLRAGLVLLGAGLAVLFAAVLRGRLREIPHDRYRNIDR